MIISLNWLKKYTNTTLSVDELTTLIGERLVEIEKVEYIGDKYKDVVVAKVVACAPLEGTDHLNKVLIDDGNTVSDVARNEHGLVEVVCGAPNVQEGIFVAWLPPKSIVPETFNDAEPFVLEAKALRGVVSNGMLASARELDLFDDHTGIVVIDVPVKPGDRFVEVYELDDYLLDIENKSLTHRPDTFGIIGFAREIAGIQGRAFTTPEWLVDTQTFHNGSSAAAPKVSIDDPDLCARFQAVIFDQVDETIASPLMVQTYLARSGVRPVRASVDIVNYVMLLTGQPSHTYDYDKLLTVSGGDGTIHVRQARKHETLVLLDGKEIVLDPSDIVIAAGDTAVGLAGAMGGASTAVDATTKRVLLEVATFDLYKLRSTQMRHGIFSEAVTRFTKGIPAPMSTPALMEATRLFEEQNVAHIASAVADSYPGKADPIVISLSEVQINATLGTQLSAEDIVTILENVGFVVAFHDGLATVTVPYWREDIHIPEDIIEEVGRMVGYDTINFAIPTRSAVAVLPESFDRFRTSVRHLLSRAGANEVLTYSFVHEDVLTKAGQAADDSYKIINSLSPELQRYRQSLTPSLLTMVHPNQKAGFRSFALFELNKTHDKSSGLTDESVPVEHYRLGLVIVPSAKESVAYYDAKRYLDHLASGVGVSLAYKPIEGKETDPAIAPFEPKRSAVVFDQKTGAYLGVIGEYRRAVKAAWKLPDSIAGFEINTQALAIAAAKQSSRQKYRPLSRYPGTERDICFQVNQSVPYQAVIDAVNKGLEDITLETTVAPLDIYSVEGSGTKNITVRIGFVSHEKTLTSEEVTVIIENVSQSVAEATEGKVVT